METLKTVGGTGLRGVIGFAAGWGSVGLGLPGWNEDADELMRTSSPSGIVKSARAGDPAAIGTIRTGYDMVMCPPSRVPTETIMAHGDDELKLWAKVGLPVSAPLEVIGTGAKNFDYDF